MAGAAEETLVTSAGSRSESPDLFQLSSIQPRAEASKLFSKDNGTPESRAFLTTET